MIQIVAVPILIVLKKIAGCTGGLGHGNTLSNGIGSGGGHGGTGGEAFYNDNHVEMFVILCQEIEEVDTDEHYKPKVSIGILDVTLKQKV